MNIRKVICKKCGYEWYYKGEQKGTTCSMCRSWVIVKKPAIASNIKRSRRKMTIDEIFDQPVYRSILYLTEKYGENGLRQLYYRWMLVKDHDGIKEPYRVKALKKFFKTPDKKDPLEFLYLTKGCITSRSNLSNYLKRLVDKPYEFLEKTTKNGIGVYHLTEESKSYLLRHNLIEMVDLIPIEHIKKVYFDVSKILLDNNEFLISKKQVDEMFHSSKEEIKEILSTALKNVSDKEKHWIRQQVDSRSDKNQEKESV